MMRAILFTALGFYLSRQFYERFDRKKMEQHQLRLKRKLNSYLESQGFDREMIRQAEKELDQL